jgi:hypothetical protein
VAQQQSDNQQEPQAYQASNNRATVLPLSTPYAGTNSVTSPAAKEVGEEELELGSDTEDELGVEEGTEDLELPELGDLPEDPEEDGEDDFTEGSPRFEQFRGDFEKAFGLPMEEARDLVQSLKQDAVKREINEQKYELSSAWDVPVTEVDRRLAVVAKMWAKLPADKQQAYDSTKGAQVLYARYEQQQSKKGTTRATQTTTKKGTPNSSGKNGYTFTQKQIDSMDAQTYSQNADAIMVAYAQGRVKR